MELAVARRRAEEILERWSSGPLPRRLAAIAPGILAREMPVLLPPEEGDDGAVGFVAGAIDLLYRDPVSGEVVVADYKTDEVESEADLAARAAAYASQGALYGRAVQQALALPAPPRFELWFLAAGQVLTVGGEHLPR